MSTETPATEATHHAMRWRPHHLLALVPAAGMLGGLPFANRVHPLVLGLPFLVAWLVGWVVATSAVMGILLVLDDRAERVVRDDSESGRA